MLLNGMKIATNIILAAIAIVLAVNILSTIEKSQVDTIKHTFAIEETKILNNTLENFILIPKKYGLDTVKIQGHRVDRVLKDITENGKVISEFTEYYVVTRTMNIPLVTYKDPNFCPRRLRVSLPFSAFVLHFSLYYF